MEVVSKKGVNFVVQMSMNIFEYVWTWLENNSRKCARPLEKLLLKSFNDITNITTDLLEELAAPELGLDALELRFTANAHTLDGRYATMWHRQQAEEDEVEPA